MAKCEACGKKLAADARRFCGERCRGVFVTHATHGTPVSPGRTTAKRRRRRGR